MKLIKKILTILILIFNVIVRRRHYKLKFVSEEVNGLKMWYYHFPLWGFNHENLLMVAGADDLCEYYSKDGGKTAVIDLVASKKDLHYGSKYDHYIGEEFTDNCNIIDRLCYGRNYKTSEFTKKLGVKNSGFWICPVTLFVLGRYPNHIYIVSKYYVPIIV